MIESVVNLRNSRFREISKNHGIYRWWFKNDCISMLLSKLSPYVDNARLNSSLSQHRVIGGESYTELYVGIAAGKNGIRDRFKWHIAQKHTVSTISNGFLSTLRRTLIGLLIDRSKQTFYSFDENVLNKFIDDNCFLEWDEFDLKKKDLEKIEEGIINNGYYPLNVQGNQQISGDLRKVLKSIRTI